MRMIFSSALLAATLASAALLAGCASAPTAPAPVTVRLIAFNDFHGNLETSGLTLPWPDPAKPDRALRLAAGGAALPGRHGERAACGCAAQPGHQQWRPHRRHAAGVGAVPARIHHRRDEPAGRGHRHPRQPRVRCRQGRTAARAGRRLPARQARRPVRELRAGAAYGCPIPDVRRQREGRRRQDAVPAFGGAQHRGREDRLHRRGHEDHTHHRRAFGRGRVELRRRGRRDQRRGRAPEGARHPGPWWP
jgi:hypothetical protein